MMGQYDLADPAIDVTKICYGNGAYIDLAREAYRSAFLRAVEYTRYEQMPGDVLEFGTYSGFTARILAESLVQMDHRARLHLFDSFTGFPESENRIDRECFKYAVQDHWRAGSLSTPVGIVEHIQSRLAPVLDQQRLFIYPGMFDQTLPKVCQNLKVSILHIDCDLYSSTKYTLDTLEANGCLQDGMVIFFDDFYCNRANPNFGEQAALRDFLADHAHYDARPWFTYSWASAAYFLHDRRVISQTDTSVGA